MAAVFECIAHEHCGNREETEQRKGIHTLVLARTRSVVMPSRPRPSGSLAVETMVNQQIAEEPKTGRRLPAMAIARRHDQLE